MSTIDNQTKAVFLVLDDSRFDFRKISGIAESTGLAPATVKDAWNDAPVSSGFRRCRVQAASRSTP
ncbi:MAG: hypothetical protein ACXVVK_08945 [Solirubrobacteraceae bacterium]